MSAKMRSSRLNRPLAFGFRAVLPLVGLLLIIAGCHKPEAAPTPEVTVQAAQPHLGSISNQITADATLSPLAQAAISPKVTAPVKKFYVQRGARVKAGELLATLENTDLSAAALDNEGAYRGRKGGLRNGYASNCAGRLFQGPVGSDASEGEP